MLRMEEDISADLEAGTAPDPEFYSAILRRMVLHKARARLREIHSEVFSQSKSRKLNELDVAKAMGWRDEVRDPLCTASYHSTDLKGTLP